MLSFFKLPSFTYHFHQYLPGETKIRFIASAKCTKTATMDRFSKLAKFLSGSWNDPMKLVLSIFASQYLSGCFLEIGSLDFFEFWHGAKNL